jgi:hypothetical protein
MGAQFPFPVRMRPIRFLLASRPLITGQVLGIVYPVISMYLVKKAGYSQKTARTGAITLIQRFGRSGTFMPCGYLCPVGTGRTESESERGPIHFHGVCAKKQASCKSVMNLLFAFVERFRASLVGRRLTPTLILRVSVTGTFPTLKNQL